MKLSRLTILAGLLAIFAVTPAFAAEPRLSVAEFDRLFEHLHVQNQPWAGISWQTSLTAARQKAARENKPIFFNVNTGNALGFT